MAQNLKTKQELLLYWSVRQMTYEQVSQVYAPDH